MKKLKDLSKSERPREKLQAKGPEALSDLELMAILLGSGTKGCDVLTVAGRIVKEDLDITAQLKSAAEILGIRLLDHIVFNQKGYYSFLEKGLL
jgi:DNA repair protein RadC